MADSNLNRNKMENYSFKMPGLYRGVKADEVASEIKKLQDVHGSVTPQLLVRAAEDKKSVLHSLFEWNDEKAGNAWRIQQARILLNNIEVTVVSDGSSKQVSVYEVVSRQEGYKSIDTMTTENIQYVKENILSRLTSLKEKLKLYKDFEKALYHVNQAIESIN